MPKMSSHSNPLTSLPSDIFKTLSSNFDLADLCNLRLTSHDLRAVAINPEFQARFHNLKTDLSFENLQSLVAICSSSELSPLIKEVTVLAKHYDDQELRQQLKDGKRWERGPGNGPIFSSTGHYMNKEEKAEAKALFDQMTELKDKQAALQADGTDIKLLGEAFSHLGARPLSLNLEAAVHIRPQGSRQPSASCRDHDGMTQTMNHSLKATIAALSRSQLQIINLSIFNIHWGGFVTMSGLFEALVQPSDPASPSSALAIPSALYSVQSLNLTLHPAPTEKIGEQEEHPLDHDRYPIYGPGFPELHASYLSSLAAFLQPIAHSITHLDIRFRGWHALKLDCATIFSHLTSDIHAFPKLQTLNLHNIVIHNLDLLSFLRSSPELRHLGLHLISLPHDPSHPKKIVNYPNARPSWSQMEPDVEGWKDGWKTVFSAFLAPSKEPDANPSRTSSDSLPPPAPKLQTLEINGLYLTSFEHRIYFTAPYPPLHRYVYNITSNESKWRAEWFKIQAFQEGLACCVFSGSDVRGEDDAVDPDGQAAALPEIRDPGNHLSIPLPRPPPSVSASSPVPPHLLDPNTYVGHLDPHAERRGVQYIVSTTRPYGSPAYYNWLHVWEGREFGAWGCNPPQAGERQD